MATAYFPKITYVEILPDLEADPIGWDFVLTVVTGDADAPETLTVLYNDDPVTLTNIGGNVFQAPIERNRKRERWDVSITVRDEVGNEVLREHSFDCGLGCRWDWTPADYLNAVDLNRVERNTEFLKRWMKQNKLVVRTGQTKYDWGEADLPDHLADFDRVRDNINTLGDAFYRLDWREIRYGNRHNAADQNAWEWDLHYLDELMAQAERSMKIYSGTIFSGMWMG